MASTSDSIDRVIDRVNYWITERPRAIILVFLLATALFAGGLGDIEVEEGAEAFAEGVPAYEAQQSIEEEFEPPFEAGGATTQIIKRGDDVVSRESLLGLLEFQRDLEQREELRVEDTSSIAEFVALTIDPTAETREEQIRTLRRSSDGQVREVVRDLGGESDFVAPLSNDFNRAEPRASAVVATATHAEDADEQAVQERTRAVADSASAEVTVFGGGILDAEFERAIEDSLTLIIPVVVLLILGFLISAYRDPFDLLLGLISLLMAIVWTFGFMGYAGIPFTDMMIAIPPLLLAIGIDFGIHAVNRFREERAAGAGIEDGMRNAAEQLLIAFFIVTGTTVIGFGANVMSEIEPISEFGFVASVGIVFTFLLFGVFLPAAKVEMEQFRRAYDLPSFNTSPLGSEDSTLGRVLPYGAHVGDRIPKTMLIAALLLTAGAGAYATTVDTTFEDEDFLPAEELPAYAEAAPGPMAPAEYTATGTINYLEENFESGEDDEVTIYVEGPIHEDHVLESVHRAGSDPPARFVTEDGHADGRSVVDVMHDHADEDAEFAHLLEANDLSGNGVPDRNVGYVLDQLLESDSREDALEYVTDDQRSMQVVYTVEADATQEAISDDADELADEYRLETTPTGDIVVFHEISNLVLRSSLLSLGIALGLTAGFLMVIYHVLEGRASLGVANLVPIVVTVALLGGTMPAIGIALNALTGTVLSITIGVGVAYSVHVTHRFIDEYNEREDAYESLVTTLRGTGGALTGSMLTTLGGTGSLMIAVTPAIGQFGALMVISVIYSYVMAVILLPPTLVVWERLLG